MYCPEYVWEMKDLTVNSKIGIFQEKYMDSQNAQNLKILPQRIGGGRGYPYNKYSDPSHT